MALAALREQKGRKGCEGRLAGVPPTGHDTAASGQALATWNLSAGTCVHLTGNPVVLPWQLPVEPKLSLFVPEPSWRSH